jgi:hypothetical protein
MILTLASNISGRWLARRRLSGLQPMRGLRWAPGQVQAVAEAQHGAFDVRQRLAPAEPGELVVARDAYAEGESRQGARDRTWATANVFEAWSVGTRLRHPLSPHSCVITEPSSAQWSKGALATIYSQHANRGKTQILATYQGPGGVMSSTVTSLGDPALAAPIVDALNRISALATVPVSVHDLRDRGVDSYPGEHLAALTDRTSRANLLSGAHSLWYEYACLQLHEALTDLDDALVAVPEPIQIAINAELEAEARELREALAEYSEGDPAPETENRRHWDFGQPFVTYDGGMDMLSREVREQLDRLEEGIAPEEREKAVADLRVLVTAYSRCSGMQAGLEYAHLEIFAEPYGSDRYFISVHAPKPGDDGADSWDIEIGHWEPDDPTEEYGSATGSAVRRCVLPTAPAADEIADALNQVEQQPELLAKWAETGVGAALAGTKFVVTEECDD